MTKRVVITGMGTLNPLGNNIKEYWENLIAGKVGLSHIEHFDTSRLNINIAGQVKNFNPEDFLDKKECKRLDRFTQLAVIAAEEALRNAGATFPDKSSPDYNEEKPFAGTPFEDIDPYRAGVIIGCGTGGLNLTNSEYGKFLEKGPNRISVFYIPMMIINMAAGEVAMRSKFKGVNYAPVTACASSTHAIGEAFRNIKHGVLDLCLCGGTESCVSEFALGGFSNMKALTHSDDISRASIPFDKERNGFVLGEGAGILLLEEYEHAKARGANIIAEISGYGATCDAYHITSPSPDGKAAAAGMRLAFQEGGLTASDVDYINAHGTSTPLNDKYETIAIKEAFGEHATALKINSTKSMTGHLLGAAGAVEAIATALQIKNSALHPTVGYKIPDPECDLDYCTDPTIGTKSTKIKNAVSNSLGFGGHNASILINGVD